MISASVSIIQETDGSRTNTLEYIPRYFFDYTPELFYIVIAVLYLIGLCPYVSIVR